MSHLCLKVPWSGTNHCILTESISSLFWSCKGTCACRCSLSSFYCERAWQILWEGFKWLGQAYRRVVCCITNCFRSSSQLQKRTDIQHMGSCHSRNMFKASLSIRNSLCKSLDPALWILHPFSGCTSVSGVSSGVRRTCYSSSLSHFFLSPLEAFGIKGK